VSIIKVHVIKAYMFLTKADTHDNDNRMFEGERIVVLKNSLNPFANRTLVIAADCTR